MGIRLAIAAGVMVVAGAVFAVLAALADTDAAPSFTSGPTPSPRATSAPVATAQPDAAVTLTPVLNPPPTADASDPAPAPVESPIVSGAANPLGLLAPEAQRLIDTRPGRISVYLLDLRDGTSFEHAADDRHVLASLAKLPIALAALELDAAGVAPLDEVYQAWLTLMIRSSDNLAAVAVEGYIGGADQVRALLRRLELEDLARFYDGRDWGESVGRPRDLGRLLASVAEGTQLSPTTRVRLLGLMSAVDSDQRWGVTAGLDAALPGWSVALKDGWFPVDEGWRVHSAGIVSDPAGRPRFVLAIFSSEQPSFDYGVAGVEAIAREIYAALAGRA